MAVDKHGGLSTPKAIIHFLSTWLSTVFLGVINLKISHEI